MASTELVAITSVSLTARYVTHRSLGHLSFRTDGLRRIQYSHTVVHRGHVKGVLAHNGLAAVEMEHSPVFWAATGVAARSEATRARAENCIVLDAECHRWKDFQYRKENYAVSILA